MPLLLPQLHLFQGTYLDDVTLLLFREPRSLNSDLLAKICIQTHAAGCFQIGQDLAGR